MKNFNIKSLGFTLFLLCALVPFSYARHDVVYICQGEVYEWDISEYAAPGDTLVYASGPIDFSSFYQEAQYDTVVGNIVSLSPSTDRAYKLISINGCDSMISDCPFYVTLHVKTAPTITIDSIKHVTCPDGYLYPYADGHFHVKLDDSVQNYAWIEIEVDTPFFFVYTSYDSVTLTALRAGVYHVAVHGTNGCECYDSVIIMQPDPWVEMGAIIDTICPGSTGCAQVGLYGGTPPYNFTWIYFELTENGLDTVFLPDTTRMACGLLGGGKLYFTYMYDSRGCKALGDEIEFISTYLYEYIEDSTHIITTENTACYGGEFMVQAQSIGEGTYTWHVGDLSDSINYWTGVYGDSMFVADYLTPPMLEPTWVYAEFSDQHHCVTRDSIWVEVYNPEVSLSIVTTTVVTDSSCTVHVSPPGGNLYLDDALISYNIPENFTFSTAGISVGEHMLKYAGIFGAEIGLACEDEISLPIQVEMNPVVPDWEYDISIYPNPATTTLNLSSTGIMDFEVSILDITGKVIKTKEISDQTFIFDVSDLSSGVYMLRMVSQEGTIKIVKFVKK